MRNSRTIPIAVSGLHVREQQGKKSRVIEGHAVVYGVRSANLTQWSSTREVFEIIERGAITQQLINKSDVVLTCFHNDQKILGRSTNGKGTLALSLDNKGLFVRCELPKTATADELLEAIQRGDIKGMSFAFTDDPDDSNSVTLERRRNEDHDGKEVWLRHVKRITGLYDVTIAGHPAYPQTDVAQREISAQLDKQCKTCEDKLMREREELAKRDRRRRQRKMALLDNAFSLALLGI